MKWACNRRLSSGNRGAEDKGQWVANTSQAWCAGRGVVSMHCVVSVGRGGGGGVSTHCAVWGDVRSVCVGCTVLHACMLGCVMLCHVGHVVLSHAVLSHAVPA